MAFGEVNERTVLASAGWYGTAWLWDLATGTQIGESLSGGQDVAESVAFGEVNERTVLASGSWDGKVLL